ncbi:chemotaxis protein CheB [Mycobacterium sp. ITM-2016-00317]|nr:chemotaxis protein CheB [Mycobacterium sp. ITM-2016-00317]WNG90114.1 chemotaxis protein CheB [Mycobacterium sp. ITM-2016-00317]
MTGARDDKFRGVVAVGGSAGGVEALTKTASGLPADLPYAVLMALHLPANGPSVLAQIIDRAGPLPAVSAEAGTELEPGHIYVAIPGRHLLTQDHRIVLSNGPSENGHRPALNALFRSVALAFGPRAVGILLSGVLDDGVLGLAAIRARGGTTLCQSPDDALFPAMPSNALRAGVVDRTTRAADIGLVLCELASQDRPHRNTLPEPYMEIENHIAMTQSFSADVGLETFGPPSGFTCPDCNGSLQTVLDGYFRCHIGHAWSADALLSARDREVQNALLVAVRSLQEKSRLARQLADKAVSDAVRHRYAALAAETDKALAVLRERMTLVETAVAEKDG